MARIIDSEGNLLGGIELSFAQLLAPLNKPETAPIQAPAETPALPIYDSKEEVRWLVCSYGSLPTVVYAASGALADNASRPEGCHNQVDKPHKRHHCPFCGGYYCITHADPSNHDCQSVLKSK